jgi:NAD(P)-dependent dehydrogenase (short-subunit alcohol dehydrogenase family)
MAKSTVGRGAVVTGGTAGVGWATVSELAGRGYAIAVLTRGRAGLDATVEEVWAAGRRALGIPTDVADHAAFERAAEQIERALGEIDLWANNASVGSLAFFWGTTPGLQRSTRK